MLNKKFTFMPPSKVQKLYNQMHPEMDNLWKYFRIRRKS